MTTELNQFTIGEISPAYWQISFSNPPIDLQLTPPCVWPRHQW